MNNAHIFEIMDRFDKSNATRLEYEANGERLLLEKAVHATVLPIAHSAIQTAISVQGEATSNAGEVSVIPLSSGQLSYTAVTAPLVGVFYTASAPDAAPYVNVGDKVQKGQLLCLIEAMKMINELPSPVSGIVKSILVGNEDVVSFGQTLFEVELC